MAYRKAEAFKVRDFSRRVRHLKDRANQMTLICERSNVVIFTNSGKSTRCTLHVVGQHLDRMPNGDRADLGQLLRTFIFNPAARSMIMAAE